ncbi:MAG: hypothetical protein KDM63_19995 [Verrucomicrobiae bacterium]|nr:hypothetical protein [Verrucomicrobiae bacterium]MCB1089330.1 hypothetical protein [Verrucomicrobiae bacterium]
MKLTSQFFPLVACAAMVIAFAPRAKAEYDIKDYRAESHLNAFAMYLLPETKEAEKSWGGGFSFDFFFNENLGTSFAAAFADPETGDMWQTYTLDFNLRFPVDEGGLAPYILVGGGAFVADGSEMLARGGAGLDIRFLPLPLFIDWIYTFTSGSGAPEQSGDFQTIRFGTRLVF